VEVGRMIMGRRAKIGKRRSKGLLVAIRMELTMKLIFLHN
jgi:hypothetical protein